MATPTRPPRPLDGVDADAIPLIPLDRVPPPASKKPRAKKRGRKSDAGSKAKRPKKPAAKKKRKAPPAAPRPAQIGRAKRKKPAPPAVVARGPSCMELFGKEGDRGEDACWHCKNSRYFKSGGRTPAERYSRVPKAGYADKAGTHKVGCAHPDGPNGRGR